MLDHFRDQSVVAPALVDLSARETETLALIARGLTVAEAARQLELTANTVASYVKVIYQKLGLFTPARAAGEAIQCGLARSYGRVGTGRATWRERGGKFG